MCEYIRNCPNCRVIMSYSSLRRRDSSESRNKICRKCISKRENDKNKNIMKHRNCPSCNGDIIYNNLKSYNISCKNNSVCKSCVMTGEKNPMYGRTGAMASFYGKHHTEETKNKFRVERVGKPIHTDKSKKKISDYQKDNAPMRGRSVYSVWVEKYGVDIANKKMKEYKNLQSFNNSGEKNSMFGKPSPNGSGNGYSGWYNGRYFRSLRELMFLIYANRYNLKLVSLESRAFGVKYLDHTGTTRTYFSDFLVNDKYFVEIKPKRLWTTPTNSLKFEKARGYCVKNELIFKLIDPPINFKLIKKIYDEGDVKFLPKYEEKFNNFSSS